MDNDFRAKIKQLLLLKKNDKFIVNDAYECTIRNKKTFSTFVRDENCPCYNSSAMIKVDGHNSLAEINVLWNIDLSNDLESNICFYDNGKDCISSLITVTDIKFL